MPDELSIKVPEDDNADPQADPFIGALTLALTEPIGDEGVASAYTPIVVPRPGGDVERDGPALRPRRTHSKRPPRSAREELLGNIAVRFDLPKEVISWAWPN